MCDSNSMQALPSQSVSGNQIPITTETVNDTVELSVSKPLGVTLCDSSMVKGVFVTVIKSEGNIAKLSQKITVGMKLLELNGVDVSTESLESVIKKISDSPSEKRLILKFQGTAPAKEVTPSITSLNTTSTAPPAASTTNSDRAPETQKEETTQQIDGTTKSDSSTTAKEDSSLDKEEEKQEKVKTEDVSQQEDGKDENTTSENQDDKKSVGDDSSVTTPEKDDFGDFACGSMDTVEITTPTPVTPLSGHLRDSSSSKDLDEEFANISLSDEKETTTTFETKKVEEVTAPTSTGGGVVESEELFDCSQCDKKLTKDSYTANQLKKKAKRKCKSCCANK